MASIIVDKIPQEGDTGNEAQPQLTPDAALASWVMGRVNRWRQYRDRSFKDRWDRYYRTWRGRWHHMDKNRDSERSRIVAPASASALEQTVAEMEEATFGREQWFDVKDNDRDNNDALTARDELTHDFDLANVQDAISESYLNGGLYGTLIAKMVVDKFDEKMLSTNPQTGDLRVETNRRALVKVEAIPADEFVPDPSGRTIQEMLGCAHEVLKPLHWVQQQQKKKIFKQGITVGRWSGGNDPEGGDKGVARSDDESMIHDEDAAMITEYHGKIPARLLPPRLDVSEEARALDALIDRDAVLDGEELMVEAIVTIANKGTLLRAVANPFLMQDRAFVATQFEKVPGRFWGRGVMEKGFNSQLALDAELRSRIDALALISNPMMGADATRLPRGFDLRVRPGKVWITNGAPKDVLQPVQFAGLEPATFNQSSEMERMVEKATGAFDMMQLSQQGQSSRPNATTSSLAQGAFVKRSKRAMNNVSRNFLGPIVRKAMWRYMQFEAARYPGDFTFNVKTTMGIMAREFEQQQMKQLLGAMPDDQMGPKLILLKGIVENSSSTVKKELQEAIDTTIKQQNSPEAKAAQQAQQQAQQKLLELELTNKFNENAKLEAEIEKILAEAQAVLTTAGFSDEKLTLEAINAQLNKRKVELLEDQNDIARLKLGAEERKSVRDAASKNSSS